MEWNSEQAQEYFHKIFRSQSPDTLKLKIPQNDFLRGLYDVTLATQDVYELCAMSSYSKSVLYSIENIAFINIIPNRRCNDEDKYKEVYLSITKSVLADLKSGKLNFEN